MEGPVRGKIQNCQSEGWEWRVTMLLWFLHMVSGGDRRKMEKLGEGHIVESFECANRMRLFCSPQGAIDHFSENKLIRAMSQLWCGSRYIGR